MFYNSFKSNEYNICTAKGACSISPNISSMQEVMFIILRQISYYLLKLIESGINKDEIIRDLIFEISTIDGAKDLSESQILSSFSKQYINLVNCRKEYLKICKEQQISCSDLKNLIKLSPKTSLSSILKKGDKEFISKYKKLNFNQKYYAEILLSLIKSVSINLSNLYELTSDFYNIAKEVLTALNMFNSNRMPADSFKSQMQVLADCDVKLLNLISNAQVNYFGELVKANVSLSTRPNKAIMVSGSNLNDLKLVLESVKNEEIDVYTNGNLLIAHAFPYFNNLKNLIGHYGSTPLNTILDFATFPGAILLTKNEAQNLEYLYRGRLFTTDDIAPKGVVKIEYNNFTPLIESAKQAKGFAKGQQRNSVVVGYNEKVFEKEINKIVTLNPDKIFVIGHTEITMDVKDYFKKFFSIMPQNTYAISFSYDPKLSNVLAINLGNDYALIYRTLNKIFEKIPVGSDKFVFFLTKCDVNSLSNIINLKNKGVKNIFLSDCPPLVINPAILHAFTKLFEINKITNPKDDLALLGY